MAETLISLHSVDGDLTIGNSDSVRRLFHGALAQGAELALDLTGARACDTTGLQLICSLRKAAAEGGRAFRVEGLSPVVAAAATSVGLPVGELTGPGDGKDRNGL